MPGPFAEVRPFYIIPLLSPKFAFGSSKGICRLSFNFIQQPFLQPNCSHVVSSGTRRLYSCESEHQSALCGQKNANRGYSRAMDVVLELFDTFVFDRLYANVLPLSPAILAAHNAAENFAMPANATWSSLKESATEAYTFQPASQLFSVQPSNYAYMSTWSRDNIWRQSISLYLITW